jgi:phosphoribosylformylglycinamidine cyclo-ligase
VLPDAVGIAVDLDAVTAPPVFGWLAREGGVAVPEMLRTFNCGIGMIAVAAPADADHVADALTRAGERVMRIGAVVRTGTERVVYDGALDLG